MPELADLAPRAAGGPACDHTACGLPAVAQWRRRPTPAELSAVVAAETVRRAAITEITGPEQAPDFGPLPTAGDVTQAVYACGPHAITLDLAAHVHAAGCTAPNSKMLPGCDCAPEPLPAPTPPPDQDVVTLPTGWTVPAAQEAS